MRSLAAGVLAFALTLPQIGAADAGPVRSAARAVLSRYGPALVTVRLTVKPRTIFEGREDPGPESTLEVQGTVIAPDGLTVISDYTSNPIAGFEREGGPQLQVETSDVKLLLQDGRELAARFVLRDPDLDLAFVAPVGPAPTLPSLAFEKGVVPAPLDDLLLLALLGRSLNREVAVTLGSVRAVIRKPRTFVVPDPMDGLLALGGPAFDGRGRPVGLVVVRRAPRGQADMGGVRDMFESMTAVVLSAADVRELAAQARAARAELAARDEAAVQPAGGSPTTP